jgi:1-acyl-sn-glycerol-3-phosphate acyltransferase
MKGMENIERHQSYMYMANHQSLFDILVVIKVLEGKVRFIAKKELFKIPVFGWALSAVGMIKIDRSNREKAIVSMNRALNTIRGGVSVIIFPEGTRSKDGLIHEFKKGGFVIAIKGGIPVVPVTIYGTNNILQKHSLKLKPGSVYTTVDKPISTAEYNYQTRDRLIEKVYNIIGTTFDSLKNSNG